MITARFSSGRFNERTWGQLGFRAFYYPVYIGARGLVVHNPPHEQAIVAGYNRAAIAAQKLQRAWAAYIVDGRLAICITAGSGRLTDL